MPENSGTPGGEEHDTDFDAKGDGRVVDRQYGPDIQTDFRVLQSAYY